MAAGASAPLRVGTTAPQLGGRIATGRQVRSVSFALLSADDIRRISVKQITNPNIFDSVNAPAPNGPYDPAMGPISPDQLCATCQLNSTHCPGHFGHIELALPVYHPLFFAPVLLLLRSTCHHCHRIKLGPVHCHHLHLQLRLLELGLATEATDMENLLQSAERLSPAETNTHVDGQGPYYAANGGAAPVDPHAEALQLLDSYFQRALQRNGLDARLATGKACSPTSLHYHVRQIAVNRFLKSAATRRQCRWCGAFNCELRKDGYNKIFVMPLSDRMRAANARLGIEEDRPSDHTQPRSDHALGREAHNGAPAGGHKPTRVDVAHHGSDALYHPRALPGDDSGSDDGHSDVNMDSDDADGSDVESAESDEDGTRRPDSGAAGTPPVTAHGHRASGRATYGQPARSVTTKAAPDDHGATPDDASNGAGIRDGTDKFARARLLTPHEAMNHLMLLWRTSPGFIGQLYGSLRVPSEAAEGCLERHAKSGPACFFIQVLAVPPNRFRPISVSGDQVYENPQNAHLNDVLRCNWELLSYRSRGAISGVPEAGADGLGTGSAAANATAPTANAPVIERIMAMWLLLQSSVTAFIDNSMVRNFRGRGQVPGIRQLLERKEGLFRKHMMGKRVNYAARSVISPDPYIDTSEIGVPMMFALQLTYPETVTPYNVHEMRQLVSNGAHRHPGATHIEREDGTLVSLSNMSADARLALAKQLLTPSGHSGDWSGASTPVRRSASDDASCAPAVSMPLPAVPKRVHRHIRNGDICLVNRQPTLHKPSIMAHRARILSGEQTIRLHYANCNTYNADFDGDEMNLHLPQGQLARAEAYGIVNADEQYLVPTDGRPLRGLIQDHILAGAEMTARDAFFTQDEYQQLVCAALVQHTGPLRTLPPTILRPRFLWTGKQIISTVLMNLTVGMVPLNLTTSARVSAHAWNARAAQLGTAGPYNACEESTVVIRGGMLLCGILDKATIGATPFGLLHACYELHGPELAGRLLSTLGRLLTVYLHHRSFTLGIADILLMAGAEETRRELLATARDAGVAAAASFVGLQGPCDQQQLASRLQRVLRSPEEQRGLDGVMRSALNSLTSSVIQTCLPDGQLRPFPLNTLASMIGTGAKGSIVNFSQISALLGQQELEGRRVPVMTSGKTLPSFAAYDVGARAGGYIMDRFLTGIRPPEYFFHCMAGREGLVDTAVKTSRSGYMQRCLVKHMEALHVAYDRTVRDADGSVVCAAAFSR